MTEAVSHIVGSPLVRVDGLRISYSTPGSDHEAVRGVSFELARGEVLAIVGESGSGKTTIANALVGMSPYNSRISAGTVEIDEIRVERLGERAWRKLRGQLIGLVPQDPSVSLNPLMRVGEQVVESLRLHTRISRADARAKAVELLDASGIKDPAARARQYPHQLSGGMRQRVLIAAAIACEPKLIIADEPTSALDVTVQRRILDHLDALVESRGMSMVLITHDLAVAADRADRIIVMKQGEIVESGPAARVMGEPRDPYTRRLLQAVPSLHLRTTPSPSAPHEARVMVQVSGLTKRFELPGSTEGHVTAVNDVSFEIREGQTLGLVGESGSGKSTLARLLLQLEKPTAGTVRIDGVDPATLTSERLRQLRRRMQVVYQNPYASLDPRFSLAEVVEEPLRSFGVGSRAERTARVRELFDLVALPQSAMTRRPAELSGGQRQRVAIARALALRPSLLVCDEPTSALDVSVQAQILDLLDELKREVKVTMLFITHDFAVVRQVADLIAVMRLGDLVELDTAEVVFRSPRHEYTRELLSAIPGIGTQAAQRWR